MDTYSNSLFINFYFIFYYLIDIIFVHQSIPQILHKFRQIRPTKLFSFKNVSKLHREMLFYILQTA